MTLSIKKFLGKPFLSFLKIFFIQTLAFSNEVGLTENSPLKQSPRPKPSPFQTDVKHKPENLSITSEPQCFRSPADLEFSDNPEAVVQELFKDLSTEEIQTRLVLAEAQASTNECINSSQRTGIYQGLAWVISNRLKNPKNTSEKKRRALFKKFHFRSSFGNCDVAQRQALLCPSSLGTDWKSSWESAKTAVLVSQNTDINPLKNIHHYYLGHHFDQSKDCSKWKGVRPDWAKPKYKRIADIRGLDPKSECLEFYEVH